MHHFQHRGTTCTARRSRWRGSPRGRHPRVPYSHATLTRHLAFDGPSSASPPRLLRHEANANLAVLGSSRPGGGLDVVGRRTVPLKAGGAAGAHRTLASANPGRDRHALKADLLMFNVESFSTPPDPRVVGRGGRGWR
jgi:hypothetical protein